MSQVASGTASIHYDRTGDGPAVVFAHGAGGNTFSWWQQVPHFRRRHTVVTFDHRCFGESECPSDDFHPRHFPGDLLAVLDAEKIDRASLVCQSMGGWTGLRTALHHPERVRCLVLCGTPGGLFTPEIAAAGARIAADASRAGITGNAALAPDFPDREPERAFLYDLIAARNVGFDPPTHLPRMMSEDARIAPEDLEGFRVPTLVLAGERDQLFAPEVLRIVAKAIPGAEIEELDGLGHSTYFEDAPRFNERIEAFLDRHAGAG